MKPWGFAWSGSLFYQHFYKGMLLDRLPRTCLLSLFVTASGLVKLSQATHLLNQVESKPCIRLFRGYLLHKPPLGGIFLQKNWVPKIIGNPLNCVISFDALRCFKRNISNLTASQFIKHHICGTLHIYLSAAYNKAASFSYKL